MPAYITLYKYTQQGLANIKGAPDRAKMAREILAKQGLRMIGIWWTLGEYDLVGVFEAPDDQAIAAATLAFAGQGNYTTRTMRAFSEEEFAQIVAKLP